MAFGVSSLCYFMSLSWRSGGAKVGVTLKGIEKTSRSSCLLLISWNLEGWFYQTDLRAVCSSPLNCKLYLKIFCNLININYLYDTVQSSFVVNCSHFFNFLKTYFRKLIKFYASSLLKITWLYGKVSQNYVCWKDCYFLLSCIYKIKWAHVGIEIMLNILAIKTALQPIYSHKIPIEVF